MISSRLFILFISISLLATSYIEGQESKAQLSILGGLNHHFEYGSEQDYQFGINDFPVNPAHTTMNIGVAFAIFFTKNLGAEVHGGYTSSADVTLTDPVDGDTFDLKTSSHFSLSVNLRYRFFLNRVRPYFFIGGGFDRQNSEEAVYLTEYGYEVTVPKLTEDQAVDPVLNLGAGLCYFFSKKIGIRFDVRYITIFDSEYNISTLNLSLGLVIDF